MWITPALAASSHMHFVEAKVTIFSPFEVYLEAFLSSSEVFPLKVRTFRVYISFGSFAGKYQVNFSIARSQLQAENVKFDSF